MRAVEADRAASRKSAKAKQSPLEPTHALLMTGPAGLSDRMAKALGQAVRSGRVGWIATDEAFLGSDCGKKLADRLGLLAENLPPVWKPGEILWESRRQPRVKTLWAAPASLGCLNGLVSGSLEGGARALYGALARSWEVVLVGHPHRAEGMPQLKPAHPLAVQERELLAKAGQLGCAHVSLDDLEKRIEALALVANDAAKRFAGPSFLTVHDVEDLAREGVKELIVDAKSRITPLAEDRAVELGLRVVRPS